VAGASANWESKKASPSALATGLWGVSPEIRGGEFFALLGLRVVARPPFAGSVELEEGRVVIAGKSMTSISLYYRMVNAIFHRLGPWPGFT